MRCESCTVNAASVQITEATAAGVVERYYCAACAERLELTGVAVSRLIDPPGDPFVNRPIGRVLEKMRKVSRDQLVEALNIQKVRGGAVGGILVDLGYISEGDLANALARQRG